MLEGFSLTGIWDGKKLEFDRQEYQSSLRYVPIGPVTITIEKHKRKRTLDQNAYIHAVPVTVLADHFGYTIPEMKLILMGECFGWKQISGHEIPVKPATSDMSVDDCKYFIDWVIPWAMTEHQVAIPLPNERAA